MSFIKIIKKTLYLLLTLSLLATAACACGRIPTADYISYRSDSFGMDGRLECGDIEYTLEITYEKDGALTAVITKPERISGCTVTLGADGSASLSFGGLTIPIADNAESLLGFGAVIALRDLVLPPTESLISAEVKKLGGQTYNLAVFSGSRGDVSVWFDSEGIPVRFEAGGAVLSVTGFDKSGAGTKNN